MITRGMITYGQVTGGLGVSWDSGPAQAEAPPVFVDAGQIGYIHAGHLVQPKRHELEEQSIEVWSDVLADSDEALILL